MANPQAEALKTKFNSGHRPPNLVVTEDPHRNCASCVHWNGSDRCRMYEYGTAPNQVCESWEPKPT